MPIVVTASGSTDLTLLSIVQNLCKRQNLPVPATVIGSTDTQVLQIQALLEEEGNDLASRGGWQGLTYEAELITAAAENQGSMTSICTNGFRYIKNQTIWSRSRRLPVCGPLDDQEWQMLKALFVNGPYYRFRIRGGDLLVNPTPPADEDWFFEYVSQNWILSEAGTTYKQFFTADDDAVLLPGTLLLQGLRWRWLREKGMDYAELFNTYEKQVKDALGRDGGKPVLSMDNAAQRGPQPGIWVPSGSWTALQ
jgi:hypothetical protein